MNRWQAMSVLRGMYYDMDCNEYVKEAIGMAIKALNKAPSIVSIQATCSDCGNTYTKHHGKQKYCDACRAYPMRKKRLLEKKSKLGSTPA